MDKDRSCYDLMDEDFVIYDVNKYHQIIKINSTYYGMSYVSDIILMGLLGFNTIESIPPEFERFFNKNYWDLLY